jgi:hypothetical protein
MSTKTLTASIAATLAAVTLTASTQAGAEARPDPILGGAQVLVLPVAERVLDTRNGDTLPHSIDSASRPVWATVAVVNVAVIAPNGPGFVTFWNCDGPPPQVAHLNYGANDVTSGMAYAPLSADGTMCAVSTGGGELVVDVQAWTAPMSAYYL